MFGDNVGSIEYDARINTSKLKGDAAQTEAIVQGTGDNVERTGEKSFGAFAGWAKVGLLAAGAATVALGVSAFKTGVEYNTLQQTSRAALKTILGSTEAASDQMNKLNDFVKTSPFSKDIFIRAQQTLLGFGVAAEKVIPTLGAIQDSVAAIGGSSEDIGAITQVLAKIKSEGRLGGEALLQLGGYGIDAATIIGSQMGKTGQEIRDMASQPGGIPVDQMWDPLVNGLSTKFGGAADNVKNTWAGTADRIGAAFRDLGSKIAAPFINPEGGGAAIEWGNKFADFLRNIPTLIAPFIAVLQQVYTWFSVNILPILQQVAAFVGGQLKQAWVDITTALAPFISQSDLIKGILFALLIPIGLVITAIIAFVVITAVIIAAIARVIGWITQLSAWFTQLQNTVYAAMAGFVGAVIGGISSIISWFNNLASSIRNAMATFISSVSSGISQAIGWFNRLPATIQGVFAGASGWLVSAGQNIVNGLVSGIKGAIGGALKAAADLGAGIKKAAESALGIKSPSTVFAEIGKNVVLGFAGGVEKNADVATNSLGSMFGASSPSFSSPSVGSLGSLDSSAVSGGNVYNINSITIGSEVDGDRWLRKLTQNQEIIGKGLTPETSYA